MSVIFRVVIFLAVVGVGAAFYILGFRPEARTAAAYKGKAYNAVPGSIVVEAEIPQQLQSEVDGRLEKSDLVIGKLVKAGEVVAKLDTEAVNLELEQLKSDFEVAQKRLAIGKEQTAIDRENAKDALDKAEFDYNAKRISDVEIAKARRTFKALEYKQSLDSVNNDQLIASLQNTIKVKESLIAKMSFTANFDGVVSAVSLRKGDLVPAKTPIGTLISTTRTVIARISEENFAGIQLKQKATVRFLRENNNYDAYVVQILPTADAETQRYQVYLDVKRPDGTPLEPEKLLPGSTGEVSIIIGEREGATLIPRRALFAGDSVYVVVDGRVQRRKVEPGFLGLDEAEIRKGLEVGDQVVVEELDTFREGQRVRVVATKK